MTSLEGALSLPRVEWRHALSLRGVKGCDTAAMAPRQAPFI